MTLPTSFSPAAARLERERQKQLRQCPLTDLHTRLAGWEQLTDATPACPERQRLEDGGLWPAFASGAYVGYRWVGGHSARLPKQILPGAILLALRGPDGATLRLHYENPGDPADLAARGLQQRGPLGRTRTHVALCSPNLSEPSCRTEFVIPGVLSSIACYLALDAGETPSFAVQGLLEPTWQPHVTYDFSERDVFIVDHEDAQSVAALYHAGGARVHICPLELLMPNGAPVTAVDMLASLGATGFAERLKAAMTGATLYQQNASGDPLYIEVQNRLYRQKRDTRGNLSLERLTEFTARITQQVYYIEPDGSHHLEYLINGQLSDGTRLSQLCVPAIDYDRAQWLAQWGAAAIVYGGSRFKEHALAAIKYLSLGQMHQGPTVYQRTGWVEHEGQQIYLTSRACISDQGEDDQVKVDLTSLEPLPAYELALPPHSTAEQEAVRASLDLIKLAPPHITVPLLGMTYRAPLGTPRFALWIHGKTGNAKTTISALCQSHYGSRWSLSHLPATWRGTAFSLLSLAYAAADVLFVIDDHKPQGSYQQVQTAEGDLQRVIDAIGDHAARTRGTRDGKAVLGGAYPRGAVVFTSELLPQKIAGAARIVAVEVAQALLNEDSARARFTAAQRQAADGVFTRATAGYIRWLAQHQDVMLGVGFTREVRDPLRAYFQSQSHARLPENLADLAGAWRVFLTYALHCRAVTQEEAQHLWAQVLTSLQDVARQQGHLLREKDPVEYGLALLLELLATGQAFLTDGQTGGPPEEAGRWGWQPREADHPGWTFTEASQTWTRRLSADHLGYVLDIDGTQWVLLHPHKTYTQIQQLAYRSNMSLDGSQAFWRRLKAALVPRDLMLCESDKVTYRRKVGDGSTRLPLIHLRSDFAQHLGQGSPEMRSGSPTPLDRFVPVPSIQGNSSTSLGAAQDED